MVAYSNKYTTFLQTFKNKNKFQNTSHGKIHKSYTYLLNKNDLWTNDVDHDDE